MNNLPASPGTARDRPAHRRSHQSAPSPCARISGDTRATMWWLFAGASTEISEFGPPVATNSVPSCAPHHEARARRGPSTVPNITYPGGVEPRTAVLWLQRSSYTSMDGVANAFSVPRNAPGEIWLIRSSQGWRNSECSSGSCASRRKIPACRSMDPPPANGGPNLWRDGLRCGRAPLRPAAETASVPSRIMTVEKSRTLDRPSNSTRT